MGEGSYSLPEDGPEATRSDKALCPAGSYCSGGVKHLCAAGKYGSEEGLSSADCSGVCPAGYFCPAGSVSGTECGSVDKYCPAGSSAPLPVGEGSYSLPEDGPEATRSDKALCPAGSYCSGGVKHLCAAGKYGSEEGLSSADCSGVCPAGYFCPAGSVSGTECGAVDKYCPAGSSAPLPVGEGSYSLPEDGPEATRSDKALCPAGSYCSGGVKHLCAAGKYGSEEGLSSADCSGVCPAGYFCPAGSVSGTECGSVDKYCPAGSVAPLPVGEGSYSLPEDGPEATRSDKALCPAGSYCSGGVKHLCAAGKYGSEEGLSSADCSGVCPAGYFCPAGSVSGTECGAVDKYCPAGSSAPLPVGEGSYSLPEDGPEATRSDKALCPAGSYCSGGVKHLCAAGKYGSEEGLSSADCSGVCPAGYFCPAGSVSGTECGAVDKYCPAGSVAPLPVGEGSYSLPEDGPEATRSDKALCPAGSYCSGGVKHLCAAGKYGSEEGLSSADCSGVCPAGYFCPAGSVSGTECGSVDKYCPAGSSAPLPVGEGSYSLPEDGPEATRSDKALCPAGSYCSGGVKHLCAAGKYGSEEGLSSADCSGVCPAGYFCPAGSVSGTECGSVDKYCPAGSSAPLPVGEGSYSLPEDGPEATRSDKALCPAGSYCSGGVKHLCAAGKYGSEEGLSSADCSGVCPAGYFCPAGSVSGTECGAVDKYCPAGSVAPLPVGEGSYSLPEDGPEATRSDKALCPAGSYCSGGVKHLCAAGKYGSEEGLS